MDRESEDVLKRREMAQSSHKDDSCNERGIRFIRKNVTASYLPPS